MSSMLREFKGEYGVRLKKISKNKENIQIYVQKIKDNWGNTLELHNILEEMFLEFIDIKEVVVWKSKIDRGEASLENFQRKFCLMGEFGFIPR